jgi:mitochondrial import receptor subunit TOM40
MAKPSLFANLPNPGKFEEVQNQAKMIISLDVFDGARFELNKALNQKFAVSHSVSMGSAVVPPTYEFGANVGDEKKFLASRVDHNGRLTARYQQQVTPNVALRGSATVSGEHTQDAVQVDVDVKGAHSYSGLRFMAGGILMGTYMQSITPSLALGSELFYHPGRCITGLQGALKYGSPDRVFSAKAGTFGNAELTYAHKVNDKVGFATELNYYHGQMCSFGIGTEFKLRNATYKGLVTSDCTVAATLEEKVVPGVANFVLSGQINHKKKDYKFGFGLSLGAA